MIDIDTLDKLKLDELAGSDGQVRGVVLLTDAEYVRRNYGNEALLRVEEETDNMGYPIEYSKIQPMHWYPVGFRIISLFAIQKALHLNSDGLIEMGRKAPKYSLITKLMLRYFVNLDTLLTRLQSYWNKNYSIGTVSSKLENTTLFICIEDCKIPESLFPYLKGYFLAAIGMIIGAQKHIGMEEYKWKHKNGTCHEFAIKW